MRIRPASEGLLVPYPGGSRTYLPAGGADVPRDRWWLRQLNRGDVVLVEDEKTPKATTTRSRRASSKAATFEGPDEG